MTPHARNDSSGTRRPGALHRMRAAAIAVPAILTLVSGCRDNPVEPVPPVATYRVEGTLSDHYGHAIDGAAVYVNYDYSLVDEGPPPQTSCTVTDTTHAVSVNVYNPADVLCRKLFSGPPPSATFQVLWDHTDSSGVVMPSGVYQVRYESGGVTLASYPVVVDGGQVTTTDLQGRFVIPAANLPIGYYPAALYSSDSSYYFGNYSVSAHVYLTFQTSAQSKTIAVNLVQGEAAVLTVLL